MATNRRLATKYDFQLKSYAIENAKFQKKISKKNVKKWTIKKLSEKLGIIIGKKIIGILRKIVPGNWAKFTGNFEFQKI